MALKEAQVVISISLYVQYHEKRTPNKGEHRDAIISSNSYVIKSPNLWRSVQISLEMALVQSNNVYVSISPK